MLAKTICSSFLTLCLLSVGCTIPTFEHPLISPEAATLPAELIGEFRTAEAGENQILRIEAAGEGYPPGFLRMHDIKDPANAVPPSNNEVWLGFTHPMGDDLIFHLPCAEGKFQKVWEEEWKPDEVVGYMLARLTLIGDSLEVRFLNVEFLIDEIVAQRLAGTYEPGEQDPNSPNRKPAKLEITATTEELNTFFKQHLPGKLFKEDKLKLVRQK